MFTMAERKQTTRTRRIRKTHGRAPASQLPALQQETGGSAVVHRIVQDACMLQSLLAVLHFAPGAVELIRRAGPASTVRRMQCAFLG